MPWTPAQSRLFHAAARDPSLAAQKGLTTAKAAELAAEGVKANPKDTAKALRARKRDRSRERGSY